MARKVFISFLGTTNYLQTIYEIDGIESQPVRFVQEALILSQCKDWTKDDKILIFCTEDAEKKNWKDGGHERMNEKNEKDQEIEKIGLEHRLNENFFLPEIIEKVNIEEGFSEEEIWGIFDKVYENLIPGDQIFFDVTHAFRSIPLFSTVLFNYARFMKETNVVSIKYGAFEKLGPTYIVKTYPIVDRVAPILDLTNIIRLQEYTDMASSLTTFGRIKSISKVLEKENTELNQTIIQLCNSVDKFDNFLLSNRMNDIKSGKIVQSINNYVKALRRLDIPTPIKTVMGKLQYEMRDFVPNSSNQNIEAAINWAVKYKMLPQAYTLGQEYIISLLAEKMKDENPFKGKKKSDNRKKFRIYLSSLCSISDNDVEKKAYRGYLEDHAELTDRLLESEMINTLRPSFSQLGKKRNALNHAKGDVTYEELEEEFSSLYKDCLSKVKSC